ncbi:MAG TPA: ATP-binding protein [Candidatus Ozemobacteraceae bacterium]|nr:ATP-binding protein [Candidatus Ozemobacteraceae bacterium]
MSSGFRTLDQAELMNELEQAAFPQLAAVLRERAPGHCMRVTDLEPVLMGRLAMRLREAVPTSRVAVLAGPETSGILPELLVTGTKLVELRNPDADGAQRPPLLVFVPGDARVAAEDSFGVATFEEIPLGDLYQQIKERLLRGLPEGFRNDLAEGLRRVAAPPKPWPYADDVAVVRYLLTANVNGGDREAFGAALYEIGLVPDFELVSDAARVPHRLQRNRECLEKLTWASGTERGRVAVLGLSDAAFRKRLGEFLADTGLEEPREWTKRIVFDRKNWGLAFEKWTFEDGDREPDAIRIHSVVTDLPVVDESMSGEKLESLVGQQVLALGQAGLRKFGVTFQTDPHPSRVQGLSRFIGQIISQERGPIGLVRCKNVGPRVSQKITLSFTRLKGVEWEEGWHFVRILPQTQAGDPVPLVDEAGNRVVVRTGGDSAGEQPPNESDLFYVIPGDEVEIEPNQRAIPQVESLQHALIKSRFSAVSDKRRQEPVEIRSVGWTERKARAAAHTAEIIEARLGREGAVRIPVPGYLKLFEHRILDALTPGAWRLTINQGVPGELSCQPVPCPDTRAGVFMSARKAYFDAILAGEKRLVTQGAALETLRSLVVPYAEAYLDLLKEFKRRAESGNTEESQAALGDLRRFLAIDSVAITLRDHRKKPQEAVLVAPTHPLRALWLVGWAELGKVWLQRAAATDAEFLGPTRDAILHDLSPVAFPPVLSTDSGSILTAVENLNHFWTLYAPPFEDDPRGLVGEICASLGISEPVLGDAHIDGGYLAAKMKRYLLQHPYVRTLVINVFHAGRAKILADMLLALQSAPEFSDIRYDLRLFVPDPEVAGVGEYLIELLSPSSSITARGADAFCRPSGSHLYPKLALACLPDADFRARPERFSAHVSLMFDVFPAEQIGVCRAGTGEGGAPVHGLVQDFQVTYRETDRFVSWHRQPRHGWAVPIEGAENLSDLLSQLSEIMSSAAATVATGQTGFDLRPVITLSLSSESRTLLHQIHEISDWVMTLDRNLGIEFFDHGGRAGRPEYLIDHSPEGTCPTGHRLLITSRSMEEMEAILRPVLSEYRLAGDGYRADAILDQLRSLSGRLVLKLISSPIQRAEALGLALARMFLEHQGVFEQQVVVPLDAHLDLYRAMKAKADELGDEVSLKRTDLALFDLDPSKRLLTCRLVEVKCYSNVGEVAAYSQLKSKIAEQIHQSRDVLSYHFDPRRLAVDRADRLLKTRFLVTLLEFYLERAERYHMISPAAADEARYFLRTMEDGYRLEFTCSALIFDFEKAGAGTNEWEDGIEFHRIGIDLIRELVLACGAEREDSAHEDVGNGDGTSEKKIDAKIQRLRDRTPSVPTLKDAAFLCGKRDHTVDWANVRTTAMPDDESPRSSIITNSHEYSSSEEEFMPREQRKAGQVIGSEQTPPTLGDAKPENEELHVVPDKPTLHENGTPSYDILLGSSTDSPQFGLLGDVAARKVALDLNQTHTISLFGVQGGGKSYTLGSIVEMATMPIANINALPQPLGTVIFHYSPTMEYRPEFVSMTSPNRDDKQAEILRSVYEAKPQGLSDVVLLVPPDKIKERRAEFPEIDVQPLQFAAAELQTGHWRFLMGAVGNQATYIRQLNMIMRSLRNDLTLENLRRAVENSSMPDHLKDLARIRLELASAYINDQARIQDILKPGRLVIVDLRDEFIEKDEALGLFVVLLQLFADAKFQGRTFNKLVVFDEAHKYIENPDLVSGLVEVVREMRHKGTSILVASQDPPSVPVSLIELSTQVILHKFNSPAWLKHIQKANAALGGLTPEQMAHLRAGEAFVWSSKAIDESFCRGTEKVRMRPRVSLHGGDTKTAVRRG